MLGKSVIQELQISWSLHSIMLGKIIRPTVFNLPRLIIVSVYAVKHSAVFTHVHKKVFIRAQFLENKFFYC